MLGILGGMGPLATADFFHKLIAATGAVRDEDNIPTLIHSVPQLPSRPAAILRGGESPLPALLEARDRLLGAGATMLAMPCNTAHYWHDDLRRGIDIPFLHIVDAVAAELPPEPELKEVKQQPAKYMWGKLLTILKNQKPHTFFWNQVS